jgi:nanoRNase/pAp phosphatase (c-di-AMP/oligoRNAs hydrolase)
MPANRSGTATKSDQLLQTLSCFDRITIVMHDNPDPDAIATGWAVRALIQARLSRAARLVGSGAIVRAENRHMVELLSPPIELLDQLAIDDGSAIVLVDCGLGTTNHLVTRYGLRPVAVIDHHFFNGKRTADTPFVDLRPDVAASASIAADYLREQDVEPGDELATAMLYAIRTETRGCETHHTDLDRAVLLWLTERADPVILAEIESAPLSRDYFADLAMALENTVVFADAALCLLPQAEGAEIVGELADLLVRCRGIRRVLSGALVKGDLVVSVRTERSGGVAASLVQTVLDGLGSGGGHGHRAGGKVPCVGSGAIRDGVKHEIRRRWLAACGVAESSGKPLITATDVSNTF